MKKTIKLSLLSVSALLGITSCSPSIEASSTPSEESSLTPSSAESSASSSQKEESSSSAQQKESSSSSKEQETSSSSSSSSESLAPTISIVVPSSTTLAIGQELQLQARVANAEGASVSWKSSNESIARVDENGKVRGLAAGQSQITASVAGVTSEPITFIVEANNAYTEFLNLLTSAEALDATKVSSLTLSTKKDEYNYHENSTTKEWENTINMSSGMTYEATFYSDSKLRLDTLKTEKGESDVRARHEYGIAHGLLIDAESDYSDGAYSFNDNKSKSMPITSQSETEAFLNKGEFEGMVGAIRFILDTYFDGTKNFSSETARTNATLEEKDGGYTLSTTDILKDNVENNVHMEYAMTIQLDSDGYLSSLAGNVKSYDSDSEGNKRRLTTDTTMNLTQTIASRVAAADIDFEQYFFANQSDLTLFLSDGPYSKNEVSDVKLNTKYYIAYIKNGSAAVSIDPIQFVSIKDGDAIASTDAYEMDEMAITFKKAGDYTLTFKTTLLDNLTVTAEIESHEITNLAFSPKPSFASTNSMDKTYLGSSVLAGDTHFTLSANEGADDDTSVEFVTNEIGATIEKDPGVPFGYVLHTENAGKVSFKFKSGSGIETPIKEVTVYSFTNEGIAAFLCNAKWVGVNASTTLADLTFTLASDSLTSGTFSAHTQSAVAVSGTFEVADNKVTVKVTKGNARFTNLVVGAGFTGIYAGAYMAHMMVNE